MCRINAGDPTQDLRRAVFYSLNSLDSVSRRYILLPRQLRGKYLIHTGVGRRKSPCMEDDSNAVGKIVDVNTSTGPCASHIAHSSSGPLCGPPRQHRPSADSLPWSVFRNCRATQAGHATQMAKPLRNGAINHLTRDHRCAKEAHALQRPGGGWFVLPLRRTAHAVHASCCLQLVSKRNKRGHSSHRR